MAVFRHETSRRRHYYLLSDVAVALNFLGNHAQFAAQRPIYDLAWLGSE